MKDCYPSKNWKVCVKIKKTKLKSKVASFFEMQYVDFKSRVTLSLYSLWLQWLSKGDKCLLLLFFVVVVLVAGREVQTVSFALFLSLCRVNRKEMGKCRPHFHTGATLAWSCWPSKPGSCLGTWTHHQHVATIFVSVFFFFFLSNSSLKTTTFHCE